MGVKFANNAFGTLNASIASGDASLTLSSGQGARFPSLSAGDYFYATLIDTSNNLEVVKCTARSSDVLTITRGQESTTAIAFAVGDRVELRVTAAGLNDITTVNLDGDKGDITVSSDGATWSLDNDVVDSAEIVDNAVGAAALNVSGNGTAGQGLISDGDGSFSWGSGFNEIADVGILLDTAGGEGPAGPSSNGLSERYGQLSIFGSSNLNMRQTSNGNQVITIQEAGKYLIKCTGAQGGGQGGNGGVAWGTISLSVGDVLYCRVGQKGMNGGQGTTSTTPLTSPEATNLVNDTTAANNTPGGGFGDGRGGDGGGPGTGNTCSGGGASAVRLNTDAVGNRIIVAGGGGGGYVEGARFDSASGSNTGFGGDGGGYYGGIADRVTEGTGSRAGGGSQTAGGFTGSGGNTGTQTQGGNGPANDGGGGGGGYWGGSTATNTPAGGGSGYVGGMDSANRGLSTGGNAGDGWIFIRKVD